MRLFFHEQPFMRYSDTSTEINFIDNLVQQAAKIVSSPRPDLSDFQNLLTRDDLITYAQWHDDKPYTRICLFENTKFELILICWSKDAQTAVHNHNEQNCWVFSVDADIEETLYCYKGQAVTKVQRISNGQTTFMEKGNKCHSLKNITGAPAMTLHLYNEPIKKCEVVGLPNSEDCLDWAEMQYDVKIEHS